MLKDKLRLPGGEGSISFEIELVENYFLYRIIASDSVTPIIAPLLYVHFKDAEITQKPFTLTSRPEQMEILEYTLSRSNYFPLKSEFTAQNDPYLGLATVLSKMNHFDDTITIQLVLRPTGETWVQQFLREKFYFLIGTINTIKLFFEKPFLEKDFINYHDEVWKKFDPKLFRGNLRICVTGKHVGNISENMTLVKKVMSKFDNGDINALKTNPIPKELLWQLFIHRCMSQKPMLINAQEAAALYHFPDEALNIANVDHIDSRRVEPPKEIPTGNYLERTDVSSFGYTNFRDNHLSFGIKRTDRNRHLYIVGKTGMGKSKLILLLALSDIYHGKGICVMDPHGDLATEILRYIPKERINDVIYFDATDQEYPIGFNPLACFSPEAKYQVVMGFINIFKKLFAHQWTNRLEHMLRFTVLALVEAGDATVIDIVRLLTDIEFRHEIIKKIQDPVVKNFWTHEFAAWNEKFDNEAIIPIINQVGQFIANDYIRNIVGQKKSSLDFYNAMQENKIIIINIAKGKLGEENTALLGSMMITKIQEATMARVSIDEKNRKEFYLYVDEFQHFATESFNQILSEARKFNLSLTIAHQYLNQLTDSIRKTVFGNVGSFISFRVGPEDGEFLATEFQPLINANDFINLDSRNIYVKLSIDGKTSTPFSAVTLDAPEVTHDFTQEIIAASRKNFGTPITEVRNAFTKNNLDTDTNNTNKKEKNNSFEPPLVV